MKVPTKMMKNLSHFRARSFLYLVTLYRKKSSPILIMLSVHHQRKRKGLLRKRVKLKRRQRLRLSLPKANLSLSLITILTSLRVWSSCSLFGDIILSIQTILIRFLTGSSRRQNSSLLRSNRQS
jgi:hypothetical protein